MTPIISLIIAGISLVISIVTFYLLLVHRGKLKMTQPTTVYFGPDSQTVKVFLRTLLFSTSKRGQIIESMFVKLYRGESVQTFNIWVYGEKDALSRGSGLFVGKEGVTYNHHFILPSDGTNYEFIKGHYRLEVYASLLGKKSPQLMTTIELLVDETQAKKLKDVKYGLYFDWGPDSKRYNAHLREIHQIPSELLTLIRDAK